MDSISSQMKRKVGFSLIIQLKILSHLYPNQENQKQQNISRYADVTYIFAFNHLTRNQNKLWIYLAAIQRRGRRVA